MFGTWQDNDLPGMIGITQEINRIMCEVSRIVWAIYTISSRAAGIMMNVTARMEPYVKTTTFEIIYSLCEGIIHSFDFVLCWNYPNWDQCITLGRCWYAPTRMCSQGCCRRSGIGCFCRFPDASFRQKLEIKQLANFIVNGRWFFLQE